jgi:hypothetical protein
MHFDIRGLLQPDVRHRVSPEQFKQQFVESFPNSSTRSTVYGEYLRFTNEFNEVVTPNVSHWIGGSFTTEKLNPRDIDVVILLNELVYKKAEEVIVKRFKKQSGEYGLVDSYYLPVPVEGRNTNTLYQSDFVYWVHQFGFTRRDRKGRKQKRGYIEIVYNGFSYE